MVATRPAGAFRDSTRYAVMAVSILCLTAIISNSLALNFTVICMNDGNPNSTYAYTEDEKGWLFSAIAMGTLVGSIPLSTLTTYLGMRIVFCGYCAVSAVSTLLMPLAAATGFGWVFAMRVLQGTAVAMSFPALGSITSQWSTLKGSGMFISLLSCHLQFGPIFTMPVSGALCVSSLGWPAIYYLQGTLTIAATILFYTFYRDCPRMHKSVSGKELAKIEQGKSTASHKEPVPYKAILASLPIWGVWISNIGGNLGFHILLQYGPTYLNKVLKYEIQSTGFATAVPYVAATLVKVVAGPFSDHATCISEKNRMVIFTIISQGCMALCFVFLAIIPVEMSFVGWLAYTAAIAFSGLNCVGVVKCAQLVSRHHIHFVMAVTSFIASSVVLILPAFVRILAPNNADDEWAMMFWIIAILIVVTNAFFVVVADATPAEWTRSTSAGEVQPEKPKEKPLILEIEPNALEKPKFHTINE
uniref:MFS domain-containing protein n=1 Tax=Steinernema glaseri TaxID=37863 RepID=A0A1I8ABJ8_9BILA